MCVCVAVWLCVSVSTFCMCVCARWVWVNFVSVCVCVCVRVCTYVRSVIKGLYNTSLKRNRKQTENPVKGSKRQEKNYAERNNGVRETEPR